MFKPTTLFALLPLFLASVQAAPTTEATLSKKDSGPSINVIFFSDNNCQTTVPPTIYTRPVFGDQTCYFDAGQNYQSILIDEIDDQFIGTNSALEVGVTDGDTCDFTHSLKYSIATRDNVGECQFVGIPTGQGKPLRGGNEYRLTTLQ
jgi:hypothetical protein